MKSEVSESMFRDCFEKAGRGGQFSYEGLKALYEECEANDPDMELDVVGLCCDWTEYGSLVEFAAESIEGWYLDEGMDDDEKEEAIREWIDAKTHIVEYPGGVLVQGF